MTATPMSARPLRTAPTPDTFGQIGGAELLLSRVAARLSRILHWEFWPSWAIYLPLVPYIAYLALRYRGITTCTLANPGIPLGGLVGESKWDILQLLPQDAIVSTSLVRPGPLTARMEVLDSTIKDRRWSWPIILKPDVGERGTDVCLIHNQREARDYLLRQSGAVLAQSYHPGPYEAGVFYIRMPGDSAGRIFSITDKRFPVVVGDGRSSIRTLIWRHPRLRVQAGVFLDRLGSEAERVPDRGERVKLGFMGNHCRGSMFLDGSDLITPALTAAIDAIAQRTPGFYFGRFDIRYPSVEAFKAGRGFQVVELNGLLSESTNIYDPNTSFLVAQRVLRQQWCWAYRIGRAMTKLEDRKPALGDVLAAFHQHAQRNRHQPLRTETVGPCIVRSCDER